jgi:hypothetical protein
MTIIYNENWVTKATGNLTAIDTNWSAFWTGSGATASLVNGSGLNDNTTSASDAYSWNAGGFSTLQAWSEITMAGTLTSADSVAPLICGSSPGGSPTCYLINFGFGGAAAFVVRRINAGSFTTIGTTQSITYGAQDVYALAFDGVNTLTVYKNLVQIYSITDGTPLSVAGPSGIWWFNSSANTLLTSSRGGTGSYLAAANTATIAWVS